MRKMTVTRNTSNTGLPIEVKFTMNYYSSESSVTAVTAVTNQYNLL
jgi:hypothetical protein